LPIKTSSAKDKGREHQKAVRDILFKHFPWLEEGDLESCSMGAGGVDIKMSPLARKTLPLSIEAKKTKKTPTLAEIKQARANAYRGSTAAVVWSPHGSGPDKALIMMDFQDFLDFYAKIADEALANVAWQTRCGESRPEKPGEPKGDKK